MCVCVCECCACWYYLECVYLSIHVLTIHSLCLVNSYSQLAAQLHQRAYSVFYMQRRTHYCVVCDLVNLSPKAYVLFSKSRGNHTTGEVWGVWLHLHCSQVSDRYDPVSLHGNKREIEIDTDWRCFLREYCKELKLSLKNNTQFLLDFHQYIERNTPDACESCVLFILVTLWCISADVRLLCISFLIPQIHRGHLNRYRLHHHDRVNECGSVGMSHDGRPLKVAAWLWSSDCYGPSRVTSARSTEIPRSLMLSCCTVTHGVWIVIILMDLTASMDYHHLANGSSFFDQCRPRSRHLLTLLIPFLLMFDAFISPCR